MFCTPRGQRFLFPALFLLLAYSSIAQNITSTLTGFVSDPTGAAVPDALVSARETQTGFTRATKTDAQGQFLLSGIPAGSYSISVSKTGFQSLTKTGQQLMQQSDQRVDFSLPLGDTSQSVTVEGSAPVLETEVPTLSTTIDSHQLTSLPSVGRSYLSTAILSPGVTPTVGNSILTVVFGQSQTGGSGFKPVSVNVGGGPPDYTAFVEDGFDVRDPIYGGALYQPSIEAISSYRLVRGFDSAEYGGEPSVVYTTSKSGTNDYHGSAFWFVQNAAFNARNVGSSSVAPMVYNQAGGTLGGPLLPKLKNRTFFFASFEGTRNHGAANILGTVPTAAQRNGDFSQIPQVIYNPFAANASGTGRQPFAGNVIPASLISSFAQKYFLYMPLPTNPGAPYGQSNLSMFGSRLNDDTQYLIRVDQALPKSGHLFVKYFRDLVNAVSYSISPYAGFAQPLRGQTASVEWTQPIGSRTVSEFRLGMFRSVTDYGMIPTTQNIAGEVLGLQNVSADSTFYGLPAVGITGFTTANAPVYSLHRLTTRAGITENMTVVRGKHTMSFGFLFEPTQWPQKNGSYPRGSITFDGSFSRSAPGGTGGSAMADFLLGSFTSATGDASGFSPLLDTAYWGAHAQDKFQVSRKLTVTVGARWDYLQPPTERYNRWTAWDQNQGKLVYVLKDPANFQQDYSTLSGDLPRGLFQNWRKTNISPRVGLAYLLSPTTTVRAGYGIYYAQGMANFQIFSTLGTGAPPFTNNAVVTNDTSQLAPQSLVNQLFPAATIGGVTEGTLIVSQDSHAPQSYVEQAVFSVEHQFGANTSLSVGYNSFLGRHMMYSYNLNQAALYNSSNPLTLAQRRPYPFYSDILIQGNNGTSSYNGLYLQFRKNVSHGVNFVANYSWAKSLDLFSSDSGGFENQDARNARLDRGLSDFNIAHYVTIGYVWDLPFGPNKALVSHGPVSQLVRDWQLSGILQFRTGLPLSPSVPTSWPNVASVFTKARPDRVCNGSLSNPTMQEYFDTSCFVLPAANSFGNAGRNVIIGPGAQVWNMSLARTVSWERLRVDLRAEAYSIFNHQNWNNPDTAVTSPTYGQVIGKNAPRQLQLGLRFEF